MMPVVSQPYETDIEDEYLIEWEKCKASPAYFIDTYCQIRDSVSKKWIPFKLWRGQYLILKDWSENQYNIVIKARQLGLTWLAIAFALHGIIFDPIFEAIFVSKSQIESFDILSKERLRGMYKHLPDWMQAAHVVTDNVTHWRLSNGSGARAFAPTNVDSYSGNLLVIDEADYKDVDLDDLLVSAEPVIDAGGKLILISRGYKSNPESYFKKLYRAAKKGNNKYCPNFLAWDAHPRRTQEWYEAQCQHAMDTDGTLDSIYEKYPATDEQALAARTLDKRIPPQFLSRAYQERSPLGEDNLRPNTPIIPGARFYRMPNNGERFVIGADPAEGNPNSHESAAVVLDKNTGEEVALLAGRIQMDTFADYISQLSEFYNRAPALVERNNHGHTVLQWLKDHSKVKLLKGSDKQDGWQTNTKSKAELFTDAVIAVRDSDTIIHSFSVQQQLQSIDGSKLKAPDGQMDDQAMAFVIALMARRVAAIRNGGMVMGGYRDGVKRG
jgi:hypothetical protein